MQFARAVNEAEIESRQEGGEVREGGGDGWG